MSNQNPPKPVAAKLKFTDAKANPFASKTLRWELLETKLAPLLDTMPHIKPVHAELVQLLADAKALEFQVQGLKTGASKVAETGAPWSRRGTACAAAWLRPSPSSTARPACSSRSSGSGPAPPAGPGPSRPRLRIRSPRPRPPRPPAPRGRRRSRKR
jgi:hypothetical protein